MRPTTLTMCLLLLAQPIAAEIVRLEDGRSVELRDDGTYSFVEAEVAANVAIEIHDPYFNHHAGEYGQNRIRFMPIITNSTSKEIIGFRFNTRFISAFGEELFQFDGESSERISVGSRSSADVFYYFEDNQFIAGQPYDILKIFESAGTGTIETTITAVAYADGTNWQASSE